MLLFLPLTVLSSAAAVHVRQNTWRHTNRLEKWFVKICWVSCRILRACLYQAKRCSREPDGFKCDAILAELGWYTSKPQSCLQRSAVSKCYEGTAAIASPSVSLSLLGRVGWTGTAAQAKQTSLTYFFTHDPTLLCVTGTWYLCLHNVKSLFACSFVVVSCNESSCPRLSILSSPS